MAIDESEVSILIPTYKYANIIGDAVVSAIATGAGEIIVTDDASHDGTMDILGSFGDKRLRIVEQPQNLGLWQNHLAALRLATKPWIKFLQADDRLMQGGLERMVSEIRPSTTIVWSNPIFLDLTSGRKWTRYELPAPLHFSSDEYMKRLTKVGWELGSPSHMLVRKDVIEFATDAWANDKSCDVVMGVFAASRGDVVLLPCGNILNGLHESQDMKNQEIKMANSRLLNTITFLMQSSDQRIRDFATIFAVVEAIGHCRMFLGAIRRGQKAPLRCNLDIVRVLNVVDLMRIMSLIREMVRMAARKFGPSTGIQI